VVSSREKLFDDIYQAICSESQTAKTVPGSNNFPGGAKIKDLDELRIDLEAAKPYLDVFIQKLNHFLYLSSEAELQQTSHEVLYGNSPRQEKVIEVCLILALGANCIQNAVAHVQWYMEGRTRLCQFGKWTDDLWITRILALLCVYHLNISLESSSRFLGTRPHEVCWKKLSFTWLINLDLALRMGLASGLDAENFSILEVSIAEPERTHWLRVWETLTFLHTVSSHDQWYSLAHRPTKAIVVSHSLSFFDCEIIRHKSFYRY
jgi:hypothetical protein